MDQPAGTVAAVRAGVQGTPATPGGAFTMYLGLPSKDVLARLGQPVHMTDGLSTYTTSTQRMSQGHHQTSRGSGVSFVPQPLVQGYRAGARRPSAADSYMARHRASGTQSLPELSKGDSEVARRSLGAPSVLHSRGYHPAVQAGLSAYAVVPQRIAAASPAVADSEPEPIAAAQPELVLNSPSVSAELETPGFGPETPGFGAETPGFGKVSPSRADPLIARMEAVVESDERLSRLTDSKAMEQDDGDTGGMSPVTPGAFAGFGAASPKVVKQPIPKADQETIIAVQQIREKINAVTEGGPGGLRRSFRVFDRNGDGSIDHREFDKVLRRYLNIRLEKRVIEKVMAQFDDTGDGKIDFRKFSELVLGSDSRSQTSLTVGTSQIKGRSNVVSDDAGNSDMMVRRKINMSFKALRASFRDLADNQGKISREDLVWVLSRYDVDLVPEQLEALMSGAGARSEMDGITWAGFAEYYRRQEEEAKTLSSDANKVAEIKGMSVRKSVQLIREKIDGVMEGGPDGLRRAFRIFDSDMSGDISYEEFDACLKKRLNLRFEPLLLASILKSFDDTGDGKIDYRKFCEHVMGSTQRTETSLTIGQIPGRSNYVSADSGNNDMMVRRKIRMSLKPLRASFRDLIDGQGGISQKDLAWVLSRYDIDLTKSQFAKLMTALGCKSEQDSVKWERFHHYFKEAEADDNEDDVRNQLRIVKGISVQQAVVLIREKIESVMQGGPDELRRAFRIFDSDMSGGISYSEFDRTLRKRLNLRFDATLLDGVMKAFDDTGDGEIDFRKFCELVMGSSRTTANSLGIGQLAGRGNFVSADGGNSDMMIRRKIRVSYKDIRANFRDLSDAQGSISPENLFAILARYDIDMTEDQAGRLLQGVGCVKSGDRVKWASFVAHFRKQEEDEDPDDVRNQLRVIKNISVAQAIQIVREKIEGIMEGGPDGLRRAFRIFDSNMNGSISYEEFETVLNKKLNLRFEPVLLDGVMKAFDDTREGNLDYRKFCELVMGSTKTTSSSLAMGAQAVNGLQNYSSADAGNSDMMVRRKVRMSWKDMRANFRDVADDQARVSIAHVRAVFSRFDIDLTSAQFEEMCKKAGSVQVTGENDAGEVFTEKRVKWSAVLTYWREEGEDEY